MIIDVISFYNRQNVQQPHVQKKLQRKPEHAYNQK